MAVRGSKRLSVDYITERVDPYQAYMMYCPTKFTIGKPFGSPFRRDDNPSFMIGIKNNKYYHCDFGDSRYCGGFIDFVRQKFNCDTYDALTIIAKDFGLGDRDVDRSIASRSEVQHVKKETLIQVITKNFDRTELNYWKDYYQDMTDLKNENVHSVKSLWINRRKINISPTELVFAYDWEDGKYWKIYRPYATTGLKWMSNTPNDYVDGLDNIRGCDKALLTKSKKDAMVIRKFFRCTCGIQNESLGAINRFTAEWLKREAKDVYVNFDGDEPGKLNSNIVTGHYGWKHINVPDQYVKEGIKDFADLAKFRGLDTVINYFKSKQLL